MKNEITEAVLKYEEESLSFKDVKEIIKNLTGQIICSRY